MDALLAEGFIYTNSSGRIFRKKEYIEAHLQRWAERAREDLDRSSHTDTVPANLKRGQTALFTFFSFLR